MSAPRPHDERRLDIALVDDHVLLAQSLEMLLNAEGHRAAVCRDVSAEAVLAFAEDHRPRLTLLDLDLGGEHGSSLPLITPLAAHTKVVVITAVDDRSRHAECVEAGAVGVIHKSAPIEELLTAIVSALDGSGLMTAEQRTDLLTALDAHRRRQQRRLTPFLELTPSEAQVLAALADGKSADRIARERYVSITTVRSQIRGLLRKLDVGSQLAAVARAREVGWLGEPPAAQQPHLVAAADGSSRG
jgi:two-component system, NarL family, nitrate/nitrite response regulator NarL